MTKVFSLVALMLVGCAVERGGSAPIPDTFYYPIGVTAHPGGRYAYVVSSNFDLRYNAATVSVIDLDLITGTAPSPLPIIQQKKIYSFGGLGALNADASRFYVPTRQFSVVQVFDVSPDGSSINCGFGEPVAPVYDCDTEHSIPLSGQMFNGAFTAADTQYPYVSAVTTSMPGLPTEYLFLSHLGAGAVTIFDITPSAAVNPTGFLPVALVGLPVNGTSALAVAKAPGRQPSVYVGSNLLSTVRTPVGGSLFYFDPRSAISGDGTVTQIPTSQVTETIDIRSIITSDDGTRTYVATRDFDTLMMFDTSIGANGLPRNVLLKANGVQRLIGTMAYVRKNAPYQTDLLYVASYADRAVDIFDADTLNLVGRAPLQASGPFGLAPVYRPDGKRWVLASYFNDDTVVVLDASQPNPVSYYPDSPTPAAIIGVIGTPRSFAKK